MNLRYLLAPLAALLPLVASAQTTPGSVGIGTTAPAASAALDVTSTSKGLLPPRLTLAQRDAIASPATGLLVYNLSTSVLNQWDGTRWVPLLPDSTPPPAVASFGPSTSAQTYTVPPGVTRIVADLAGAAGRDAISLTAGVGGKGGRVQATLAVVPGETLTLYVGSGGSGGPGGYAGSNGGGGNGGGGTDLRQVVAGTLTRVLVAGGGGGGGGGTNASNGVPPQCQGGNGGAGGGPAGGDGGGGNVGGGGTQTGVGAGYKGGSDTSMGGAGGTYSSNSYVYGGGGGGGGYYGGSGGGNYCVGGGGGSSYAGANTSAVTFLNGVQSGAAYAIITPLATPAPVLDATNFINTPWTRSGALVYPTLLSSSVGIGTSTPSQKLDVSGNANVSGNSYVGGSVGVGTTSPMQALDVNGGILARASGPISNQGAYLQWNRSGGQGETWLLNQQGGGPGAILFGKSDQSNNATEWARFDGSGNLGIGTTAPAAPLQVNGIGLFGGGTLPSTTNATGIGWNAVNPGAGETELYNYRGSGGGGFRFFAVTGTGTPSAGNQIAFINSAGAYTALSDRRVKTNIAPLGHGLRTVLALRPVAYDFHTSRQFKDGVVTFLPDDKPVHALGFVAQDLYRVVPEAVEKPQDDQQAFYTVSYTTLVPVLTQAIQEQQAQIEELKQQNAALQAKAATAEAAAAHATSEASAAKAQATQATATLDTFEARLRRLEASTSGQAQR